MKKEIITILIIFVLIIYNNVFVSSNSYKPIAENKFQGNVFLQRGWNLVSIHLLNAITNDIESASKEVFLERGIEAIYLYDYMNHNYIRVHPDKEKEKLKIFAMSMNTQEELNTFAHLPIWIYLKNDESFNFNSFQVLTDYEKIVLKSGWNMISISPSMIEENKSLKEIKGNCNIEKSYIYSKNKWKEYLSNKIENNLIWSGIIIKVEKECSLGDTRIKKVDFPENIDGFIRKKIDNEEGCPKVNDRDYPELSNGEVCFKIEDTEYEDSKTNKVIFIKNMILTKNPEIYHKLINRLTGPSSLSPNIRRIEKHELLWYINDEHTQVIMTQEGEYNRNEDGMSYNYNRNATASDSVSQYLLNNYPPKTWIY